MIILNVSLNQEPDFDEFETDILTKDILAAGFDDFICIDKVPYLLNALEVNRHQEILLFSNFSPNEFYKNNGIDVNEFRIKPMPNWQVEQYSFSAALFYHICKKYSIIEIHFITSAFRKIVSDTDFESISNDIHSTVQRKRDWFKSDMEYNVLLKNFMLDRIYVTVNSILIPRDQKFFVHHLMNNYCQN